MWIHLFQGLNTYGKAERHQYFDPQGYKTESAGVGLCVLSCGTYQGIFFSHRACTEGRAALSSCLSGFLKLLHHALHFVIIFRKSKV